MTMMQGIDVSHYQGAIDFAKVKAAGKQFVIIKAGYGRYNNQVDPYFERNYKEAKKAGLYVGAYWYSYAHTVDDARREAAACINTIKGKQFDLPIYYDFEEMSQFSLGRTLCSSIIDAFCKAMEASNYYVGIYIYRGALESYVTSEVANRYAVAVAEYASKCNYKGQYGVWQYSGSGYCNGINTIVDLDNCYVDYPAIMRAKGKNGYVKENTKPAAVTYKTYYANDKSGVNYRSTPNGSLVGTYKYGEAVQFAVNSDVVNGGVTWIKASNGYWSAKNLFSTTKPQTVSYKTYFAADSIGVNYRATPNGVLKGTYKYAQAVEIVVGSETVKDGLVWVKAKNGYWSVKSLLSTTKPATVIYKTYYAKGDKSGVNYRRTPNGIYMGTYKYGQKVEVILGSETINNGKTWVQAKNGFWSLKSLLL